MTQSKQSLIYVIIFILGGAAALGLVLIKRQLGVSFSPTGEAALINQDLTHMVAADRDSLERAYPFLNFSKYETGIVSVAAGEYHVKETVVIPMGLHLVIEPGVIFKLDGDISIVSYSPITAESTIFERLNNENAFGVIAIVTDAGESQFKSVTIEGGHEAKVNGIYFSGALSVHGSKAVITDSTFSSNSGEDGINIKNGEIDISNSVLQNNARDGIDLDSSLGKIENNTFDANANDAVDTGKSNVVIANNSFANSKRCLALQESSEIFLVNNTFSNCMQKILLDGTSTLSSQDAKL